MDRRSKRCLDPRLRGDDQGCRGRPARPSLESGGGRIRGRIILKADGVRSLSSRPRRSPRFLSLTVPMTPEPSPEQQPAERPESGHFTTHDLISPDGDATGDGAPASAAVPEAEAPEQATPETAPAEAEAPGLAGYEG